MSAGTLTLTNNSAAVGGSGTAFTTELAAGDFIVVTVGGVPYTLPVKSVASNTSMALVSNYTGPTQTGAAWYAVPRVAMNLVTAALVAQSAEALRGLNYDKQNWQSIFSGTGNVPVKLPDGSTWYGPAWNGITTTLNGITTSLTGKADLVNGAVPVTQGGTGGKNAGDARTNLGAASSGLNADITSATGLTTTIMRDAWIPDKGLIVTLDAGTNVSYNNKALTAKTAHGGLTMQTSFGYSIGSDGTATNSGPSLISTDGNSYTKYWKFQNGSGAILSHAGTFTPGVSDIRVKNEERIISEQEAVEFISNWESIVYSLKWTPHATRVGFRAQDIYARFPELIERSPLMDVENGGMIEDGMIVNVAETAAAYLVPVVQQLLRRVGELEKKSETS